MLFPETQPFRVRTRIILFLQIEELFSFEKESHGGECYLKVIFSLLKYVHLKAGEPLGRWKVVTRERWRSDWIVN